MSITKLALRIVFPVILLALTFTSCDVGDTKIQGLRVDNGIVDFSSYHFSDKTIVNLEGDWFFWPNALIAPSVARTQIAAGYRAVTPVPGIWSTTGITGPVSGLMKTGTLAAKVKLPPGRREWAIRLPNANTACTLFIDGRKVATIGSIGQSAGKSVPNNGIRIVNFDTQSDEAFLVLQVSNFHTPYTGTWDSPSIGSPEAVARRHDLSLILQSLVSGTLLFMGLYHLLLHIFRRKDANSLIFGVTCLLIAIRNLIMGDRILIALFPPTAFGWEASFTVEHLSVHMAVPLLLVFFRQLFPRQVKKGAVRIAIAVGAVWAALELFTPALFHHRFLPLFEYFTAALSVYVLFKIFRALFVGEEGAPIVVCGLAILIAAVIDDILLSRGLIRSVYLTSIGMFFFLFAQAVLLCVRFTQLFSIVERFTRELQHLNQSLERFIPHEVLNFLGKRSIVDIGLGDFSEERMSVLFLDIRDFTSLSETMSPNETFRFINEFLERFGPIVRNHGGFIDKYLGDGFMALFPGDCDDALDAALAMRKALALFNAERKARGSAIRVGIGIHSGPLMFGTIGENQRMDSTVISDTVNTASRLEQLTKAHRKDILVSSELVRALVKPDRFALSRIGRELVKGKAHAIEVFSLEGPAGDSFLARAAPSRGAPLRTVPSDTVN